MQLLWQNATVHVADEDLNNEALPLQKPILEQSESEFCALWGPCNALGMTLCTGLVSSQARRV